MDKKNDSYYGLRQQPIIEIYALQFNFIKENWADKIIVG
jgi:hypothetical protein